jgi:hypothetical protein
MGSTYSVSYSALLWTNNALSARGINHFFWIERIWEICSVVFLPFKVHIWFHHAVE